MNEKLIELVNEADGLQVNSDSGDVKDRVWLFNDDELAKFAELVREEERKSKWQSMEIASKERAILVFDQQGQDIAYWSDEGWMSYYYRKHISPTHWQPLPAPPQESEL